MLIGSNVEYKPIYIMRGETFELFKQLNIRFIKIQFEYLVLKQNMNKISMPFYKHSFFQKLSNFNFTDRFAICRIKSK